ncbi:Hypothetical protein I595_53 [Croceitalea dokdonensis DOKDO 023]|uniref:Integral membrane protein n=1 Tax=Croceitalea dokdonensis DOKDO 023 TaxID=1300341 RepID=A0A0P7AWQ3_9FLAO|nr:TMEM175 family protein [Croceitalea dokdonensis]KPM33151.1 Hypothetical protein I595_53 [Croceitalea dokdonensis DOKDO 023]
MKFLHNISRIEAFSDGVFAFAATLMVVNFDMGGEMSFSKANLTGFLAFFVSFFVLVALWWVHYNFFRRTDYMDNKIITLNSILLFVTLYYVFPLKSLVQSWMGEGVKTPGDLASLFVMYGIGFMLIFLCFALMYYRATTKSKKPKEKYILHFYFRHFLIFVVVGLLSIVLASAEIGIRFGMPGFVYALLGPFCALHSYFYYKNQEHQL